jgi:hypothetical protein
MADTSHRRRVAEDWSAKRSGKAIARTEGRPDMRRIHAATSFIGRQAWTRGVLHSGRK